jgi:hypothetical protein
MSTAEPVISVGGTSAEPVISVGGTSAEPVISVGGTSAEPVVSDMSMFPKYDMTEMRQNAATIKELTTRFTSHKLFHTHGDMCASGYLLRSEHTKQLGWSVWDEEATECILKHVGNMPVLSLAAGKGSQEASLAARGATVVCTDKELPRNPWMPVECLTNDAAVQKWRPFCPAAMIVWPQYTESGCRKNHEPPSDCVTYKALLDGNFVKVIYIGEEDGCTGSPQLESFLSKNYTQIEEHYIPCWPGIHDSLRVYERKTDQVVAVPKPK